LCLERERLGYEMQVLAAIGHVTRKTQYNYENNKSAPTSDYLDLVAAKGVDAYYVLTGHRGVPAMSAEQERAGYVVRVLSPQEAAAVDALRGSGALANTQTAVITGNQNSINQSQGGAHERPVRKARSPDRG